MSVILETSKGDIVIDLFVEECPKACTNFLKLCKIKYYNNCLFYNVQANFLVQTGDPTNTGKGGDSVYGQLYGPQARFFEDEIRPGLKHTKRGMVGMASAGEDANASQFYITTAAGLDRLDGQHTVFGEVAEGWDVLDAINDAVVDGRGRPLQNIRVRHTIVLDDPTPDPRGLADLVPDASPAPEFAEEPGRLEDDWAPEEDARPAEEIERSNREKEARNRAVVLEMIGDLPEADAAPPADMLFVCKLNPVTTEEDLETIFSRFGGITSCDIIRDWKTGDSLSYAFIGFATRQACEAAYYKMNNVLIDDRRIRVDFSQSVSHLWRQFRRHGGRGTADMAGDAAQHQRQATPARQDRLELKERFRGPTAVYGSHHRGGGDYELLVEEDVRAPQERQDAHGARRRGRPEGPDARGDRRREGPAPSRERRDDREDGRRSGDDDRRRPTAREDRERRQEAWAGGGIGERAHRHRSRSRDGREEGRRRRDDRSRSRDGREEGRRRRDDRSRSRERSHRRQSQSQEERKDRRRHDDDRRPSSTRR